VKKIFLCIFLAVFIIRVFSQDTTALLTGRVYDKYNERGVSYAHVINRAVLSGTISDSLGIFTIPAAKGDTLFVSAMGYQFDLAVVDSVSADTAFVVNLVPRAYMLPEVVIYELNTYEKFKKRFAEIELEEDTYQIPGLPHVKPFGVPSLRDTNYLQNPLFALRSPISFLYYNFSKREKNRRKYYQLVEEEQMRKKARLKYSDELIMRVTGIEEDEIDDFLRFCDFDPQYILSLSDYEIYQLIIEKHRKYRELNNEQ